MGTGCTTRGRTRRTACTSPSCRWVSGAKVWGPERCRAPLTWRLPLLGFCWGQQGGVGSRHAAASNPGPHGMHPLSPTPPPPRSSRSWATPSRRARRTTAHARVSVARCARSLTAAFDRPRSAPAACCNAAAACQPRFPHASLLTPPLPPPLAPPPNEKPPGAAEELRRLADGYLSVATSELPAHAHLSGDERGTLEKEAKAALAWLQDKLALQVWAGRGVGGARRRRWRADRARAASDEGPGRHCSSRP
jgi:hypothetical protein